MEPHEELLECFREATDRFNLCPNRVWTVARENLPNLLPKVWPRYQLCSGEDKLKNAHELCTVDFCELSQRDFTAVQQRHECNDAKCIQLRGLFSRVILEQAALAGASTAWDLTGKVLLAQGQPYMAISHVWSDGTGTGAWRDGQVNQCLYWLFQDIAKQLQCKGIWWDTICIPKEKAARNKAIRTIQDNYRDARVTLVHDCFLRNWEWHPKTACFGILMSPWFSRGWTALELANSRKVKVIFKGPYGSHVIKDLDEEILCNDDAEDLPRREATAIIKLLRVAVERNSRDNDTDSGYKSNLNNLLMVLGSRHTSWPKDMALISALLTGVQAAELQQDTYQRILITVRHLFHGHLFHNSATMSKSFRWCPTSLFSMPLQQPQSLNASMPCLTISADGDLQGKWRLSQPGPKIEENLLWGDNTHPLIRRRIKRALEQHNRGDKRCYVLAEPKDGRIDRALLVMERGENETEEPIDCQYVGAVYFREPLSDEEWVTKMVTILGDGDKQDAVLDHPGGRTPRATVTPETLQQAVWRGNSDKVQALIGKEFNLDVLDPMGRGALHLAAERGDEAMMKVLLASASLKDYSNLKDGQGQTVLHRATWAGSISIVKCLVQNGVNIAARDNDGNHALHMAAQMGFEPIVQLILDLDESLANTEGCNNLTPLHYAALNGHAEVVQMLLVRGADSQRRDTFGWMPLHYAAGNGNAKSVELLMQTQAHLGTDHGWTPLHIAAMSGHERAVELIIRSDVDQVARDDYGWTPRRFAIVCQHLRVAKLFPSDGTDANPPSDIFWTPLHVIAIDNPRSLVDLAANWKTDAVMEEIQPLLFAAKWGLHTAIRRLLGMGRNIEVQDEMKRTPLLLAAMNGHETTVQILVDKDANTDSNDTDGRTPLSWAAEKGHMMVIQLLLETDVNINMKDKDGRTPLHWAMEIGNCAVAKLLLEQGADVSSKAGDGRTALHLAAKIGSEDIIKLLLEKGANTEAKDNDGHTPLSWAAMGTNRAVVIVLLDGSADIDVKDINGWTPLRWAVENRKEGIVKLLLEKGASMDCKANDGRTPFFWAVENENEGIVRILLDEGANVSSKADDGQTVPT
ncbi:Uncharacterized protein LW94_10017 [Fusarium fujikuroi]|nr:Uncharacterized protein LW94_10017 [Fusarium fujikuroi]